MEKKLDGAKIFAVWVYSPAILHNQISVSPEMKALKIVLLKIT